MIYHNNTIELNSKRGLAGVSVQYNGGFLPNLVRGHKEVRRSNGSLPTVGNRGAYYLVHGDLPRQHPFGTTLRFTGPVPADSLQ